MTTVAVTVEKGMGKVPISGQWINRGDTTSDEYTLTKGEHFPPAIHGSEWVLTDRTRHKGRSDDS